jgi:hypothetical protein
MAIIQAILALITKSAGKILNAIFGWAVHALFGRTAPRDQTFLSGLVGAAVAWPLLVVGVVAPKVATVVLAFVPLSNRVPSWIVRVVWLALALLVPLALGMAIASKGRGETTKKEPVVKRLLRGFPLTLGLALAFVIMFVSVPVMRFAALVRRQKSADVPLAAEPRAYHHVAAQMVRTLNAHGFRLAPAEPGWWVQAPMRILAWFGGSAFGTFVPTRPEHFEEPSLQVSFYTSGPLLRGEGQKVTWAHGLIEEAGVHTGALQTFDPEAQQLERRIRRLWTVFDGDPVAHRGSAVLRAELNEVMRQLGSLDAPYDEWQSVYRQSLQLDRALQGQQQLLQQEEPGALKESNMRSSEGTSGEMINPDGHEPRVREVLSTPALVKAALHDVTELVKTHVQLARAEIRADLKSELTAAKGLGIGALAALTGVNLLLVTGILALALVMPGWAAGLVVSGAVLIAAAIAGAVGWSKRIREPIHRTRHELKEEVRWAKERTA